MSADTIARWNAIPLVRPDRTRPDEAESPDDDESEDNVSLVSRSPSPEAHASDAMDPAKYDEYVKGPVRESITVETKISDNNIGFRMLASMGWVEGQPLGLSGDGRVDPVPFYVKNDLTGLGKVNQDVRMIESTVAQRRELDSERQTKETEEQRRAREDTVARREALKSEISTTLRAFYCELCDKQFQNVAQYDEHTNSYAHHHKARFRDMQAAQRASRNTKEELDRRKEKERKREEKELRKIAKAAGVKMAKPPISLVAPPASTAGDSEPKPPGFKKSGWASVGQSSLPFSVPPAFRTGGWTSLDTGSTIQSVPSTSARPVPSASAQGSLSLTSSPLPLASSSGASSGWSVPAQPSRNGWASMSSRSDPQPFSLPTSTVAEMTATPQRPPSPPQTKAPREASRSGWQQFRAGAPGRRRK
ncbi:hypothetical protein IEO21_00299 [Rhodonia placenta]|uniref:G-patch domain-containing protein n=1 Tax=Rhodonia placenta TaxID=104341 RepID=A0A8H7PBN9_9APHY|nr:hypothetical protein IEO21_00299 [Postia placenta]